jgi:hypothetical protein
MITTKSHSARVRAIVSAVNSLALTQRSVVLITFQSPEQMLPLLTAWQHYSLEMSGTYAAGRYDPNRDTIWTVLYHPLAHQVTLANTIAHEYAHHLQRVAGYDDYDEGEADRFAAEFEAWLAGGKRPERPRADSTRDVSSTDCGTSTTASA